MIRIHIVIRLSIALLLTGFIDPVQGQDLNARVQILSPQVQNTNKRALEVLQKAISDFLNNRTWSAIRCSHRNGSTVVL